jgi:exonuclease SbcC
MIRSIRIRDFQRHRNIKIRLDQRITTIVGPSDCGKSAVLRALRWVMLNDPRGDKFIRKGAKRASVTICLDGHKITRSRGTGNSYILDGEKFHALGNGVPQEIASILNVSDLNFQKQIGSPYLFASSPGEVSRELNGIVDLSVIDTTLANLAQMIRRTRSEIDVIQDRLKEAQEDVKSHLSAREMDKALRRCERLEKRASRTALRASRLNDLLSKAREAEETVSRLSCASRMLKGVRKLERLSEKAINQEKVSRELENLIREAQRHSRTHKKAMKTFHKTEARIHRMIGETCPLCGKAETRK